ncbi:1,4-alpha-glucan branching enzyme [Nitrospira sp. KM1]|uniref:1,4-alpha-glucan branching protein GlgB n=1 Tax=Nitrospira sp. KM1 TaxID=1936990 RepID=UPI0013A72A32|nr:1,4-alpha-glucan branching protein GlgB [Nitrospira sp. KM1]BCA53205.1 1,4-alpha-glucan branching enzyme [Nitrospira sp. KM1]
MSNLTSEQIERLANGRHWDPLTILGPHRNSSTGAETTQIRCFLPDAAAVSILLDHRDGSSVPMARIHESGLFEATVPRVPVHRYRVRVTDRNGNTSERYDPYGFQPLLTDFELHLFAEGRFFRAYDTMGAHCRTVDGVQGVHFVVWAPNAARVSVVGDFNQWNGLRHPMISRGATGLWELFIPGLTDGTLYKYEIRPRDRDAVLLKADPYAVASELRPKTASVARDTSQYMWNDGHWMQQRATNDPLSIPISIYEVHLGSWMRVPEEDHRWLTYRELAAKLIPYVVDMGYTHVELMPITEHPFDGSWGYQSTGYFAVTCRYGTPEDFMAFVDAAHQAGLGVLMDWAPAHFPDDPHGLSQFDGTHLYDHADPRLGYHPDWHSRIFNYGRVEVRNFLMNSALFWLDRYHIDGLRVDAVASMLYLDYGRKAGEWIPNQFGGHENLDAVLFLKDLNVLVHRDFPGAMMLAEESTSWAGVSRPTYSGGLGFTFKWNMGWMHDMLDYFHRQPIHRMYHQNQLTFGLLYAFNENFVLPLSHDEVVHGKGSLLDKMPGDEWQRFANLRALFGFMFAHPGKKMLFMGGEFGQWREWNHDSSLDWHLLALPSHAGLQRLVRDLNRLYREEPALHEIDHEWTGFQWLDFHDAAHSILAFLRKGKQPHRTMLCVCNFTPVPRYDYRIGVPHEGYYREMINTDASIYGGGNIGNGGGLQAHGVPSHGLPASLSLTIPPLSVLLLKAE